MSTRIKSFTFRLILLASIAYAVPPLEAQFPPTPPPPTTEAEPETAAPEVPLSRLSPRASLETFLGAFYDDDGTPASLDRAAAVLDLSEVPKALRAHRGRELASQLKAILDRVERIDPSSLSDQQDAPPWRLPVRELGEIVLAPNAAGDWRFTRKTLEQVPRLYRSSQDWRVVEGVQEGPTTAGMWLRQQVPSSLQRTTFLLETWQWLGLLALIMLGLLLERLVASILRRSVIGQLSRRFDTVDTDALANALRPVGLLMAGLLWWSGIFWLDLPVSVLQILLVSVRFAVVVAVVWVAYRFADLFAEVLQAKAATTESKFDDLLAPLVRKSLKLFVAAFGLVFIADNLDIDISSLLAGLGIGGIAVALAAQDVVKNLFGSVMVILDRPFAVGDWVVIEDVEGTVDEVGFRSTRVRTFYNSLVTVPNARLISTAVDNYGARRYRRWSTTVGLTYDTPADKLEAFTEGVRELIRRHPETRKDYFEVHVKGFSASAIDVMLYLFFETPDWTRELAARHRLALDILRLAQELGVAFAYPTQTVHVVGQEAVGESPDGPPRSAPSAFDPSAAGRRGREAAAALTGASE